MAASNLNLGKASGGVLNIQPADGTTNTSIVLPSTGTVVSDATLKTINGNSLVGSGDISLINLSSVTAYHLLQGNLAVSNYTTTQGFNTTLYTGNGSTQSITTGIDMSTQWGNTAEEKFGGLVWVKGRNLNSSWHTLVDTVRGVNNYLATNSTNASATGFIPSITSTGFSVNMTPNDTVNASGNTFASWNFQTTHRVTGTTNHGKAYTCHYNPFTGFTIVKYEGSGLAGHEIPHMLGRKLGFTNIKCLTNGTEYWQTGMSDKGFAINSTNAFIDYTGNWDFTDNAVTLKNSGVALNATANTYILYGWANSYFDKSNKLIGNYEIGVYQGTGTSGNKVTTRGKPAWVMAKRLDSIGHWMIQDNQRVDRDLYANLSQAENPVTDIIDFNSDGITFKNTNTDVNASGGQYLYIVAYDTNYNGGGSYYPLASDTANVQVNNALIPIAQGIDSNGAKNTILSKNETFSGVTYTQGKNYPYYDALGNRGVSNKAPNYGTTNPSNGGDFYNVLSNKWYTSAGTEITNGRNYLNHIVYADNDGGVLYVEELPKIEYKDIVKANEFKGKNACTAWVNFDGTTTPPTIRDSYNVSAVIRTSTGTYDIYFKELMDNVNYGVFGTSNNSGSAFGSYVISGAPTATTNDGKYLNKVTIGVVNTNATYNPISASVEIKGGKN